RQGRHHCGVRRLGTSACYAPSGAHAPSGTSHGALAGAAVWSPAGDEHLLRRSPGRGRFALRRWRRGCRRASRLRAGVLHRDLSKGARMDQLSLGVMARSLKENERRLAIHPLHVERIAADLRERIYLERGYGERFGVPDEHLAACVAGLRTRAELVAECDVILLPKPQPADLAETREGQVLWGWPHCVQGKEFT